MAVNYPHTGTLDQRSVRAIVAAVQQYVPEDEVIFTAQPLITALSQREIAFAYTHPGWYRDEYLGKLSPQLRSLYFADPEVITEYLRTDARFVLTDRRTNDVYFEFYPERQLLLQTEFELVAEVDNPLTEESLKLFVRRSN